MSIKRLISYYQYCHTILIINNLIYFNKKERKSVADKCMNVAINTLILYLR